MKALGIGMIIVTIGMALIVGNFGLDFYWTHHPPETFAEAQDMEDQMKVATSLGLAGGIIVLVGVVIFIIEFMIHGHKVPRARPTRVCPGCGRAVPPDTKFCPHCGKEFPA